MRDTLIVMAFSAIISAAIFSNLVRSAANKQIKSGNAIIIGNSSYQCKMINTLD